MGRSGKSFIVSKHGDSEDKCVSLRRIEGSQLSRLNQKTLLYEKIIVASVVIATSSLV